MIEEKIEVPNDIKDFRNVLRLEDPEAGKRQVYFLYCAGFVKIGVARSILRRASELQIGSPWKSQIVLLIPGGRSTEAFLHFAFQEHRVGGEWFRLAPPIRKAIQELAPAECLQWLAEEEETYRDWVRQEALQLGLIKEPHS
jgi:hypothetical protein